MLFKFFKNLLCLILSLLLNLNPLLINQAHALQNDITVDNNAPANYQPHLKSSANGTDVVDITAPTASGTSINHWDRINNTQGMIFNNSQYDGISRIGGAVGANININQPGNRAAEVIINQVNGTSRSHFSNVSEIFGAPAQLLISNPNGVTCNGCSFIGAPKVTLTTGKPLYDSFGGDWNKQIDVDSGEIIIGDHGFLGINTNDPTRQVSYADIIAQSIKIIGNLTSGNEVNLILGRNLYNYQDGSITKKAANSNPKPTLALDASLFGSVTSGRIKIIATEDGVGVKSLSNLASRAGDIIIKANGDAVVKNFNSSNNINLDLGNYLLTTSNLVASGNINLEAANFNNEGLIQADRAISFNLQESFNNPKSYRIRAGDYLHITAKQIDNYGVIDSQGNMRIKATNNDGCPYISGSNRSSIFQGATF